MSMRFSKVTIGQSFLWQEKEYIKEGPLTAREREGKPRVIPRSAVVELVDADEPVATKVRPEVVATTTLLEALDRFYADCLRVLEKSAHGDLSADQLRSELERQKSAFLSHCDLV